MPPTVVVEQQVDAEPATVYAAWSSATALARWWWPHIPDTTYEVDFRIGGRYEIRSAAAGIGVQGEFTALDAPHRIGMTWRWMTDGVAEPEEPVSVRFEATEGGTRVSVRHEVTGDVGGIRDGWESVLARLASERSS